MRVLFICGSLNQTKMMYKISQNLPTSETAFTPYYCDAPGKYIQRTGLLDFTVLGGRFFKQTMTFLNQQNVKIDYEGKQGPYDLVLTCSDLVIPRNIRKSKIVLVQEGMTDPENFAYHLVKTFKLPRWVAHTSTTGMSNAYDIFCVASEGYQNLFVRKGAEPEKLRVTGIPNFDNCEALLTNNFPHKDYLLVATSDMRETYKYENRRRFIEKANKIADGRPIIFKFHPNENADRAAREVERYSPQALYFKDGNTDHMIANCSALLTRYSTVVYVAIALGKEVHSDIPLSQLQSLLPMQNGGRSAANIANECLKLFG